MPSSKKNTSTSGKKIVAKSTMKRKQKRRNNPERLFQGEKCTVMRRELWKTFSLTANTALENRERFKYGNFPAWFDKLASCYEHYHVRKLKFAFESSFATTTSGSFVLSYNTVYTDTLVTDKSKLMAQKGARSFRVADKGVTIEIPAQALQQTPSRKTCRFAGTDTQMDTSYLLDVVYSGVSSAAGPLYLYVEYVVDFYTPQLN